MGSVRAGGTCNDTAFCFFQHSILLNFYSGVIIQSIIAPAQPYETPVTFPYIKHFHEETIQNTLLTTGNYRELKKLSCPSPSSPSLSFSNQPP